MKGIITVLGTDNVGIIAKVCTLLAESSVNILDISQTIVQGYLNMMMIVEFSDKSKTFEEVTELLEALGEKIGVVIKMQNEEIFNSMHRI